MSRRAILAVVLRPDAKIGDLAELVELVEALRMVESVEVRDEDRPALARALPRGKVRRRLRA